MIGCNFQNAFCQHVAKHHHLGILCGLPTKLTQEGNTELLMAIISFLTVSRILSIQSKQFLNLSAFLIQNTSADMVIRKNITIPQGCKQL